MSEVELVFDSQDRLGEGPTWSVREQALYWVNILGNEFHRLDPVTGAHEKYNIGKMVGTVVLRESGGFVLALNDGLYFWDQENGLSLINHPEPDRPNNRFNDGAVDRQGRFWAGTMPMSEDGKVGALYRLDTHHNVKHMVGDIIISNGLGWSPDNKTMYYCDTAYRTIWAYDFDPATGEIDNRRDYVVVPDEPGEGGPDGLTVDSEGFVWSARWGGWKIVRYDPDGKLEREIKLPAERITSVMFGGANLDELYITSARMDYDPAKHGNTQPHAGSVFRVRPGVKGLPETDYKG